MSMKIAGELISQYFVIARKCSAWNQVKESPLGKL